MKYLAAYCDERIAYVLLARKGETFHMPPNITFTINSPNGLLEMMDKLAYDTPTCIANLTALRLHLKSPTTRAHSGYLVEAALRVAGNGATVLGIPRQLGCEKLTQFAICGNGKTALLIAAGPNAIQCLQAVVQAEEVFDPSCFDQDGFRRDT
jgi:hypothetical protein